MQGGGWGLASAHRLGGEEAVLDVGREARECENASGAGKAPTQHPWLLWEMGRPWGPSCTGGSSPSSVIIYADQHRFRMPQLPFSPKGLISYLFPNYNLTLLERPEFLMPKAGRVHLALSREQGPMAFPLSAYPSLLKTNRGR